MNVLCPHFVRLQFVTMIAESFRKATIVGVKSAGGGWR